MNISRQKLIEELMECSMVGIGKRNPKGSKEEMLYEDYIKLDTVLELIESQPPADQWIPCSEGTLPANGRTVPVTNEVSQGKRYMTTATYYTKKGVVDDYEWTGEGFYQYDSEYGYGRLHNVVAWLNVEPYKGVE